FPTRRSSDLSGLHAQALAQRRFVHDLNRFPVTSQSIHVADRSAGWSPVQTAGGNNPTHGAPDETKPPLGYHHPLNLQLPDRFQQSDAITGHALQRSP